MLKVAYVRGVRAVRRIADRTGVVRHLDAAYRRRPDSLLGHLRTLFAIHDVDDLVDLDIPWWTYSAVRAVEEHLAALGGTARVFEYGSGASTVWLGRRSGSVHSVEHHPQFAAIMRRVLAETRLSETVTFREVPPAPAALPSTPSRRRGEAGRDYTAYVQCIDQAEGPFDLVVVDGRARAACCAAALRHLAPGGIIVFDDSQRPRYKAAICGAGLPVRRVWGWAPSLPYPRETALLGPAAG